ncbi:MAG: MATE family efflux transporter [Gammaproteobacteria bacterium]|nr:MATE family efflux transporter [Gammaproteobacteria bacterium]
MSEFSQHTKKLIRLAVPVAINDVASAALILTDMIMAGRLGIAELAAVGIGSLIWWSIYGFSIGVVIAIRAIVGQQYGARKYELIGQYTTQALWVSQLVAVLMLILYWLVRPLIHSVAFQPTLAPHVFAYLDTVVFALPSLIAFFCLRYASEGIAHTKAAMYVVLLAVIFNIFADWVLMFGKFGLPAMGVQGTALATVITTWFMLIAIVVYIRVNHSVYQQTKMLRCWQWPKRDAISEILRLGVPIGIADFSVNVLYAIVGSIVGVLAADLSAIHQVLFSYEDTIFRVSLALYAATNIAVSLSVGSFNPELARRWALHALMLASIFLVAFVSLGFIFRHLVAGVYTADEMVREGVVQLFWLMLIFQVFNGLRIVTLGALRGYKDVRVPMFMNFAAFYLLGLPVICIGVFVYDFGLAWVWFGLSVMMGVYFLMLLIRFIVIANREIRDHPERDETSLTLIIP